MRKSNCCNENGKWHCNIWKCIGWGILGVIGFVAIMALLGWAIMALWNALIPGIFNLPTIGYWQGIGLAVLSRLLFSGMGFHRMHGKHHGRRHCGCHGGSDKECCSDKGNDGDCCEKKDENSPQI